MTGNPAAQPDQLRQQMVDQLRTNGTLSTPEIEQAMRTVPRHLFVPVAPVADAYADTPIYTKADGSGESISAASQPTIVAMMLEQFQPQPGERILEIGAGTGYNAALLAHLVGPGGHVTTVDVDDDIVEGARAGLTRAGVDNVEVVLGDGAQGVPEAAPYDRIIATVGAHRMPSAWLNQVVPDGLLVVPLRLRGSVSRSLALRRSGQKWVSVDDQMCTFMPLRAGVADDPRQLAPITSDGVVTLQINNDQNIDSSGLAGVLDHPAITSWTEVTYAVMESLEWMDLWLTCALPNGLSRMTVTADAKKTGLVKPAFGWGAMATAQDNSLAYLTLRTLETAQDRRYEVGVIGHGPDALALTAQLTEQIRTWDSQRRGAKIVFELAPTDSPRQAGDGRFEFDRADHRLTITWQ